MVALPLARTAQQPAAYAATDQLITLDNISKHYHTAAGPFPALKNVDLSVKRGEFIVVAGKSGAGKTTLVNMITGIDEPTSGEIWINGTPVHDLNEGQMARWRGQNVGIVFQQFALVPTLSVLQNIILPMALANKFTRRERKERAMYLLEQVSIPEQAHKRPSTLSGGQQQRAAIARALANDPAILIADEPTGNLDSRTAEQVFGVFQRLVANGTTILMVTHDEEMARRVDRTITLVDGLIVSDTLNHALEFKSNGHRHEPVPAIMA